jgi:hypothetical protein
MYNSPWPALASFNQDYVAAAAPHNPYFVRPHHTSSQPTTQRRNP